MIVWCEACGKREAWAKNLKHPICAECAVLAWQKLSEDAESAQQSVQRTAERSAKAVKRGEMEAIIKREYEA